MTNSLFAQEPPAAASTELFSVSEATKIYSFSTSFLRTCIRDGRLPHVLVPNARNRIVRKVRKADLDALVPRRTMPTVSKAEQLEVHARMGGKKCNKCGAEKALSEFPTEKGGLFGVRGNCKVCDKERWHDFYDSHREQRRRYRSAYGKANRDRINAYKREHAKRIKAAADGRYERKCYLQRLANQRRIERRTKECRRYRRTLWRDRTNERAAHAVLDGKNSPITRKKGFALVCAGDQFRAARLDYPLAHGERKIAEFTCPFGSWVILRPLLALSYDEERLYRLLQARETREAREVQVPANRQRSLRKGTPS